MDENNQLASFSSDESINQINLDQENYSALESINNIVNNKKLSDVTFLVGVNKKLIYCHKVILSLGSPVFERMFYGEFGENSDAIEITDITETGFLNMLKYIYGYEIDYDLSELYVTYKALDKYLVYGHDKKMSQYIEQKLNKSTCCIIYDQLVKMQKNNDYLDFVESFIQINCSAAFSSKSFLKIDEETLIKLLDLDFLNLDEFSIFKACSDWVNYKVKECFSQKELRKSIIDESFEFTNCYNRILNLKYEKFSKIKNYIKFSELNVKELAWSSKFCILSFQEMGALFIWLTDKSNEKSIIECNTKRRSIKPFTIEDNDAFYDDIDILGVLEIKIKIAVNRKILISSFSTFVESSINLSISSIKEDNVQIGLKFERREVDKKWCFYFYPYLELEPDKEYKLKFNLVLTARRCKFSKKEHFIYNSENYSVDIHLKRDSCNSILRSDLGFNIIRKIDFFDCSMSSLP